MAINVNTVYQTVLLILNKEQRGYMTPVEFNKTGAQAQLEIFETYFDSLNQQIRIPQTNTDYADRVVNLDEKISIFKKFGTATSISLSNVFELPGYNDYTSGLTSASQTFNTTTATTYTLTGNALTLSNNDSSFSVFFNGVKLAPNAFSINGPTVTLSSAPAAGQALIVNLYANEFYRLGKLFYTSGALATQELERVTRSDLFHLNSSNLTKPSTTYPIYVYENNQVIVYPITITNGVQAAYIRKPIPPQWNFTSTAASNYQYIYQPETSVDFEIHSADQTELTLKILLYAGVVIEDPQIVQVAAQQVQQENINQQR